MLKSVHIINKNNNINKYKHKNNKIYNKIKLIHKRADNKKINFIMIISIRLPILQTNHHVIMYGYIMSVQYGYLNVILNKKMVQSILKEFKILIKEDLNINVLYVKKLNLVLV